MVGLVLDPVNAKELLVVAQGELPLLLRALAIIDADLFVGLVKET